MKIRKKEKKKRKKGDEINIKKNIVIGRLLSFKKKTRTKLGSSNQYADKRYTFDHRAIKICRRIKGISSIFVNLYCFGPEKGFVL